MGLVVLLGVWGEVFGTANVGKIQWAAQMLTVLASAVGPLLLAVSRHYTGTYVPLFQAAAGGSALLGLAAWCRPAPPRPAAVPVQHNEGGGPASAGCSRGSKLPGIIPMAV